MTPQEFKAWRKNRKLTLDGAAAALHIARSTVFRYEHGMTTPPGFLFLACQKLDDLAENRRAEAGEAA